MLDVAVKNSGGFLSKDKGLLGKVSVSRPLAADRSTEGGGRERAVGNSRPGSLRQLGCQCIMETF